MPFPRPLDINPRICEIFGEDPSKVRSIKLEFSPDSILIATIERFVQDSEVDDLFQEFRKFAWIENPEKESKDVPVT